MSKTCISFILPLLHPENARDWSIVREHFGQTIESLSRQSSTNWQAIIVANTDADLPEVPTPFRILRVDFPPNDSYEREHQEPLAFHRAIALDKGRRFLAGALAVKGQSDYLMNVDCDDFVHRDVTRFVEQNSGANGWKFVDGYLWNENSYLLGKPDDFSLICGTSLIIRTQLLGLPDQVEGADPDYLARMLGDHVVVQDILAQAGTPLQPLPFAGSVYRTGHSQSHGHSRSAFRRMVWNRHTLTRPGKLIGNLAKFRPLTNGMKQEFGMPV